MRARAWLLSALVVTGCHQASPLPTTPVSAWPLETKPTPTLATPLADAPVDPSVADHEQPGTLAPSWSTLQAIAQEGGLVRGLESLEAPESAYRAELVPANTQDKAEQLAHAWAPDARQVYVGWGFWKISLLGRVRHVYYSKQKHQALQLEYSLTSFSLKRTELDGTSFKDAFLVLRDAYDTGAYNAKDCYAIARRAGYHPSKNSVGCLLDLVLVGPVWAFLDDQSMTPTVVVKADSGEAITHGPLMWAVQYLIKKSASN